VPVGNSIAVTCRGRGKSQYRVASKQFIVRVNQILSGLAGHGETLFTVCIRIMKEMVCLGGRLATCRVSACLENGAMLLIMKKWARPKQNLFGRYLSHSFALTAEEAQW
jgi:hypothetical protein